MINIWAVLNQRLTAPSLIHPFFLALSASSPLYLPSPPPLLISPPNLRPSHTLSLPSYRTRNNGINLFSISKPRRYVEVCFSFRLCLKTELYVLYKGILSNNREDEVLFENYFRYSWDCSILSCISSNIYQQEEKERARHTFL